MHGTSINGRRIEPNTSHALKPGDVLKFGDRVTRGIGESSLLLLYDVYELTLMDE